MFGDLFRGVRAHGSLFGSSALTAPWALHFVDGAPLTLCTVLGGSGWIVPDDSEAAWGTRPAQAGAQARAEITTVKISS